MTNDKNIRSYTISVLVNDQPGVLQRVCGLFGRRGFNIESITVGGSEQAGLSRMTLVTTGDEATLEQVQKQLNKLIDVIAITDLNSGSSVSREIALIKVKAEPALRPEIFGVVETFRASVIDIGPNSVIVQAVGESEKIEAFVMLLQPYGVLEIARTGSTAMIRGEQAEASADKLYALS
ncbi:Acetolactate synthase small subunit [Paenibacillus konkukensis]|uniref:Acetolactate synthase small subunit n=1 Tax=Paenibacillus konkukensis TaxID=2020716 RepID=A0ABY4RNE4_9BACL|nr:acetolactate synthase small subunit [Paenibacillus konkukensis]UQZ83351.1 Acetolactate synthase small subunit [Paenibacillus konkukensis]